VKGKLPVPMDLILNGIFLDLGIQRGSVMGGKVKNTEAKPVRKFY
jgi:hypothetical protein